MGNIDRSLLRRALFVQDRYQRIVTTIGAALGAMAADGETSSLDPGRCGEFQALLGPAVAYAREVVTVDAGGRAVCRVSRGAAGPAIVPGSIAVPEGLADAASTRLGVPTLAKGHDAPLLPIARALGPGGRGAVVFLLDLVVMSDLIASVLADDGSQVLALDSSGAVVAASDRRRLGARIAGDLAAATTAPGSGLNVAELDGVARLYRMAAIPGTPWTAVALLDRGVVADAVVRRVTPLAAAALLGFIAVGLVALAIVRMLLRPLRRLADALARIDPRLPGAVPSGARLRELRLIEHNLNRAFAAIRLRDREIERRGTIDRQLRAAVSNFSEALLLWDADDRLLLANEAARRMFPESAALLVAGTPFETLVRQRVYQGRIPAARGREEEFIAARLQARRSPSPLHYERHLDDGRWIQSYEDAIGDGGVFVIHRDVTAEKRAQLELAETHRRTASVLEALAEGVIVRDARGRIVEANAAACRILDLPRDRIVQTTDGLFVPARTIRPDGTLIDVLETPALRTLREEVDLEGEVIGILRPDDETRWVSANTRLVRDAQGRPELVITSFSDITAERLATARTVEKSRIIAAASHDLRQPLHAQGLLIRALERRVQDPEAQRVVASLKGAVGSMSEMLNSLLDLSRLEAGVVAVAPRATALAPLLGKLAEEFAIQASASGLALRLVQTSLWVRSDAALLETMLRNLIANALRYTRAGGVVIGCRRRGAQVRICVVDSGPGIAAEDRERIFKEFERGAARGVGDRGMGLGLAIVARLAELVHAEVGLRSELGRGSCFSLTVDGASPTPDADHADDAAAAVAGMRLAILDDDARICEALSRELGDLGHEVRAFATASDLVAAEVPTFDGFVVDLDLGRGEGGLDVVRDLRANASAHARFVVVTGDSRPATLIELKGSGVPFLIKPVDGAAILRRLRDS